MAEIAQKLVAHFAEKEVLACFLGLLASLKFRPLSSSRSDSLCVKTLTDGVDGDQAADELGGQLRGMCCWRWFEGGE